MTPFAQRRAANAKIKHKHNSELPAGSPMYYYCRSCGAEMVLPESHREPAPHVCRDCWSEGRKEP